MIIISKNPSGTPWLPSPNSTDEEVNLERVDTLFTLFAVELAISILGFVLVLVPESIKEKVPCYSSDDDEDSGLVTRVMNNRITKLV